MTIIHRTALVVSAAVVCLFLLVVMLLVAEWRAGRAARTERDWLRRYIEAQLSAVIVALLAFGALTWLIVTR